MKRNTLSIAVALLMSSLGANLAWASTNFKIDPATASNYIRDGIYISPYTADIGINGVPTLVICDDFADEVAFNETWQANVSTLSTVASSGADVKWATDPGVSGYNEQNSYNEAAWLTTQLLLPANQVSNLTEAEISYAIWAVFDANGPLGVKAWLLQPAYNDTTVYNAVFGSNGLLYQASLHSGDSFPNVLVYTPVTGTESCCGTPQEFLAVQTVRADEASTITTFGFDFTCLAVLLYFFRRHLSAKLN